MGITVRVRSFNLKSLLHYIGLRQRRKKKENGVSIIFTKYFIFRLFYYITTHSVFQDETDFSNIRRRQETEVIP